MSDTALIAVVVLGGIFLVLGLTIIRHGVDGAIKVWGLLGVGFGAIISFYFTNQSRVQEVAAVTAKAESEVKHANQKVEETASTLRSLKTIQVAIKEDLDRYVDESKKRPSSPQTELLLKNSVKNSVLLNDRIDKSIADLQMARDRAKFTVPGRN